MHASDLDMVVVDGKILMENKNVKTLQEEKVMLKVQKTATNLLKRKGPIVKVY
jgi:5-methylthioadenosine/S-adenosylhomocysteine deaminase